MFKEINHNSEIDVVVITGDITDNGDDYEVDKALELICTYLDRKLVLGTVGNHDKGPLGNIHNNAIARNTTKKLFRPMCNWSDDWYYNSENYFNVDGIYSYAFRKKLGEYTEETLFYVVDSADLANSEFFARGKISKKVCFELGIDVREAQNSGIDNIVVICHHHPFIRPTLDQIDDYIYHWGMELENGDEFIRAIRGIDLLLFGHKHVEQGWCDKDGIKQIHAAGKTRSEYSIIEV
jgi:3',5'-cyclic AMP phosphodiesterase CpdA